MKVIIKYKTTRKKLDVPDNLSVQDLLVKAQELHDASGWVGILQVIFKEIWEFFSIYFQEACWSQLLKRLFKFLSCWRLSSIFNSSQRRFQYFCKHLRLRVLQQ